MHVAISRSQRQEILLHHQIKVISWREEWEGGGWGYYAPPQLPNAQLPKHTNTVNSHTPTHTKILLKV